MSRGRKRSTRRTKGSDSTSAEELERLRKENADLRAGNAELQAAVERLTGQVDKLGEQVAELAKALTAAQRAGKRQAAPFRRKKRKTNPKKPGRKPGHKGERRANPDRVDHVRHGPDLTCCPDCRGGVRNVHQCVNYEVDLPEVDPVVTQNLFHCGWCPRCGKLVYAPHPEQTSTATGAAACHLGPRVRSFAVDLKHRLGVPYGKVVDLLKTHFDFEVSPGGIVLANHRLTTLAEPTYEAVRQELSRSDLVHADETGWRVGTDSWWLWVTCNERLTVYQITDHRSAKVVREMLGSDFSGRLFRDGWASYDTQLPGWGLLRCLLHLKHNAEALLKAQSGADKETPQLFLTWFEDALRFKGKARQLSAEEYARRAVELEDWWDYTLEYVRAADDNERNLGFRNRMAAAEDQILPIVREPGLPAANNRAEQQIRPAVIIRKVSAGNKTERGARTHEVLASLAASCRQQAVAFADVARRILLGAPGTAVRFWQPDTVPT